MIEYAKHVNAYMIVDDIHGTHRNYNSMVDTMDELKPLLEEYEKELEKGNGIIIS